MTVATLATAAMQALGVGTPGILFALALGNVAAFVLILWAWGNDGVKDLAAFLFKSFFNLEVKGLENLPKPGERAIIAPNHVSLLDAPLMHALLPSHSAYAIDTGMAKTWWVRPFLKLVNAYSIDPTKPMVVNQA